MKRNIRTSNLLLLFVISLFCLSCGGKKEDPNAIKFWHFWSEPNQKAAIEKLIKQFEVENDCNVELTELSWNDGKTKLVAAFNSGAAPDVLELGSDWVAQFSANDILSEIDTTEVDFSEYLDYSLPPAIWGDKYYAIPWIVDTRVLFYNKDLMKKYNLGVMPPTTYEQLLNFSNAMNNPELGEYGFGTNGSDPHRLYKKILPIMWTFGGGIFDKQGNPTFNSPANMSAVDMYLQLSRAGIIESQRQLDVYFAQGKIGFVFSGSWLAAKIKQENPMLNYGVALMPNFGNRQGISFLGCEFLAVNKKTQKRDLSLKLIKFLTDGKNALALSQSFAEGGFPAAKNYFNDSNFKQDAIKMVFASQLKSSQSTPVHPLWLDVEKILEDAVTSTLYGEKNTYTALYEAQIETLKLLGVNATRIK